MAILQEILPEDESKRNLEALLKVLGDEIQAELEKVKKEGKLL